MYELEDSYWWFVARRELVRELVLRYGPVKDPERPQQPVWLLLDVGCGTGATLKAIDDIGFAVGLDRSLEALQFCRQRGLWRLAQAMGEKLPVRAQSVEVVLALDLLEHIEDDAAAAKEFARVLKPGGVLIVTVPACPELWSEHDEALDHLRRYRARRLRKILTEAGFQIEKLSPIITLLLLPIAALRLIQRVLPKKKGTPETAFIIPPKTINWVLTALLRLERLWLRRFNLPVGVSLVAVARKP
jgi:SAM-dependent methyltransferase